MTTLDRLLAAMKENGFANPGDTISPGDRFDEDLQLDSLDKVEIAMLVEDVFNLTFDDDAITEMKTVQQLVDAIDGRKVAA